MAKKDGRKGIKGARNVSKRPEVREKIRQKMLGRKITWGDKISKAHIGKKMPKAGVEKSKAAIKKKYPSGTGACKKGAENYGNIHGNPFKGRHHTKEAKQKIGEKNSGCNSGMWQGGISNEPYDLEFNKELKFCIKLRDNFICQYCGAIEDLVVHHINYNKKDSGMENLITLCRSCHSQTNVKRRHFTNFFNVYRDNKKCIISHGEFELRCRMLSKEILKIKEIKSIYGVPRAGMLIAIRLSYLTGLPMVLAPSKNTAVVDDIIDGEKNMHSFSKFRYFFSLVDKDKENIKKWVTFWWEEK